MNDSKRNPAEEEDSTVLKLGSGNHKTINCRIPECTNTVFIRSQDHFERAKTTERFKNHHSVIALIIHIVCFKKPWIMWKNSAVLIKKTQ